MKIRQYRIILSADTASEVPQLPERCLSRKAGIVRCQPLPCTARTRYHQPERPATATLLPNGRVRVDFAAPQRAIAPGQAVVLYNGESVIGGGTILNVE